MEHFDHLPRDHARFLQRALPAFERESRIVGIAAGGSFCNGAMDSFSDLDLVLAVEDEAYEAVMSERAHIAAQLGPLLESFTGEHVGESRLLICLFNDPLLHVDLKFVSLGDVHLRVEDPVVLLDRDRRLAAALGRGKAVFPPADLEWIEKRFWTWLHYAAAKVGRGEIFEVVDFLAFLRARVLGPLALQEAQARPSGVRKIEQYAPARAREMEATVATYDAHSCVEALRAATAMYRSLRHQSGGALCNPNHAAEFAAIGYLDRIAAEL